MGLTVTIFALISDRLQYAAIRLTSQNQGAFVTQLTKQPETWEVWSGGEAYGKIRGPCGEVCYARWPTWVDSGEGLFICLIKKTLKGFFEEL